MELTPNASASGTSLRFGGKTRKKSLGEGLRQEGVRGLKRELCARTPTVLRVMVRRSGLTTVVYAGCFVFLKQESNFRGLYFK